MPKAVSSLSLLFATVQVVAQTTAPSFEAVSIKPSNAKDDSSSFRLNRSAFPITETELNVIAALAIIGRSSSPKNVYRMPAATGTPTACRRTARN
jgi:hypothetical protein